MSFSLQSCFHCSSAHIQHINSTIIMMPIAVLFFFCCLFGLGLTSTTPVKDAMDAEWNKLKSLLPVPIDPLKLNVVNQTYCTCGVFLSGQFKKASTEPPKGYPALMHEQETLFPCTPIGAKQCSNKCLETVHSFLFHIFFLFKNAQKILQFVHSTNKINSFHFLNFFSDCKAFAKLSNYSLRQYWSWCFQRTGLFVHPKLQWYMAEY